MALGLNKTKRRIASVKSTQKITKAMGMIASVKLKRCKDKFEQSELYRGQIGVLASKCLHYAPNANHPLCSCKENARGVLYIVITSDLGLCAGYNSNLIKYAHEQIFYEEDSLILIGEKGRHHFSRDPKFEEKIFNFDHLHLGMSIRSCLSFADEIAEFWKQNNFRQIVIVYTHYVNSLRFEPRKAVLLPLSPSKELPEYESYAPPLFEPEAGQTLDEVLRYYLMGTFYNLLSESELSEQSSRRNAMDNANDNADELLEKLTIEYNKARQSAITQEIVEVVSGASNAS